MYETIVLGATFLASGIASRQKKNCLILEQSLQAGYEFFGALNYGADYDAPLQTAEAEALRQKFFGQGVTPYMRNSFIYPILQESNIRFGTQVISVEKKADSYLCRTYGVDGFASFSAKNVIDTRCSEKISLGKTYNLLMESDITPQFGDIIGESTGIDHHYVLRCPVSLSCDYGQARLLAEQVIRQFSPGQRLILLADEFDYQVEAAQPDAAGGVRMLPSKAYKNPLCAFEAGLGV